MTSSQHSKTIVYSLVILGFGILGTILLTVARATPATISLEPENGTVNNCASKVNDTTASGTRAVSFGGCSVSFLSLLHKGGAYALGNAGDIPLAASSSIQLALTAYRGASDPLTIAMVAHNMYYVDVHPESLLYYSECPGGLGTCAPLSTAAKQKLLDDVKTYIQKTKDDPQVAAYYLLDDYWSDFSGDLPDVYRAIRSVDSKKPTVCAFYMPLGYTPTGSQNLVTNYPAFQRAITNFSPNWCNAVAIYSYSPGLTKPLNGIVEWDMHTVLPEALKLLRLKGWDNSKEPLIGMPQSFGYNPRTGRGNGQQLPQPVYLLPPTQAQLTTQITAFCKYGAQSLIGYVWYDGSTDNTDPTGNNIGITELYNSLALRGGMKDGVAACRSQYWP